MLGYIDNFDFKEMEAMKYFAPPANQDPKQARQEAMNKVFSGEWYGARKMDGAFFKFVKDEDGNKMLLSRSRSTVTKEFPDKIEWIPHLEEVFSILPKGTCVLGEIFFPTHEGSSEVTKIMGCKKEKAIERQKNDKLHFYIFDVLAYDGNSLMEERFIDRIEYLKDITHRLNEIKNPYVHVAKYYNGQKLWARIEEILANGGEGAVITHQDAKYSPKSRSKKLTLKIKKEISNNMDMFVINSIPATRLSGTTAPETWNFWENVKTGEKIKGNMSQEYLKGKSYEPVTKAYFYDWPGSLIFGVMREGRITPVCSISGLPEEVLSNYENYKGKVAEISAMEVLSTGGLRHPRLIQWRPDKNPEDCKWEDIFE